MATLSIVGDDLFHTGLALASGKLLLVIKEETKNILGDKLHLINKKRLSPFVNSKYIARIFQLGLFVQDIQQSEKEQNVVTVKVSLSLPVLVSNTGNYNHNRIWTRLKEDLELPGFVDSGDLWLDIKLRGEKCPIGIRGFNGDSRKTFVTISELTEQNGAAA